MMRSIINHLASWRKSYLATLKPLELEELPELVLCRPVAFLLAKGLRPTRVTPNAVSLFALAWSLVVAAGYWRGDYTSTLWGGAAYYVWNVLDCADGQLARLRGGGSLFGSILDETVDLLSNAALFVGIAHGLSATRPGEHSWWLLSAVAALATAMQAGLLEAIRHQWISRVYGSHGTAACELAHAQAMAAEWRRQRILPLGRLVISSHVIARRLQNAFVHPSLAHQREYSRAENDLWSRYHRKVLRMAVWLGPATHMVVALSCTVCGRIDLYLWCIILLGFPWMGLVHVAGRFARCQEQQDLIRPQAD